MFFLAYRLSKPYRFDIEIVSIWYRKLIDELEHHLISDIYRYASHDGRNSLRKLTVLRQTQLKHTILGSIIYRCDSRLSISYRFHLSLIDIGLIIRLWTLCVYQYRIEVSSRPISTTLIRPTPRKNNSELNAWFGANTTQTWYRKQSTNTGTGAKYSWTYGLRLTKSSRYHRYLLYRGNIEIDYHYPITISTPHAGRNRSRKRMIRRA